MSEYSHYVTYHNAQDQIRDRVERTQRTQVPGVPRHRGRKAVARGLHSIASRLEQ